MKLYALTLLSKATQYSKEERIENGPFPTSFVVARSLKEARKQAVEFMPLRGDRVAVTEVGEALILKSSIDWSTDDVA